jgi:hypothetical protein
MFRVAIALASVLFPLLGWTCDVGDRQRCEKLIVKLVTYRKEAIEGAFGNVFSSWPNQVQIKFVSKKDPEFARFEGREGYDADRRVLILPRHFSNAKIPNPLSQAGYYWPHYQSEQMRAEFPIVEAIDNILWSAYLQEAAQARGQSWPHKDCASIDMGKRLPCEMLVMAIAGYIKDLHGPIFNSNRLDRIWPENFAVFAGRVWRDDKEYLDVQRYGGLLLIRPLVQEFGVTRTLAYIAKTPFRVEENDMRVSALRYQERAREEMN